MVRISLISALAALCIALAACASSADGREPPTVAPDAGAAAIPVEVTKPIRTDMLATYAATATLEAEADAGVVARVGGQVERILVEEGLAVRAGQLLAVLDGRQLRLQAAQARAQLAKAERDYRRQIELNQRGLIAAGAFEGTRFDLENLRASHELAQLQLSYTELRAPFAGIVAERHIRRGQNLPAGTVAFRITDSNPLKASVFVPERELNRLKPGQIASVQVEAVSGTEFPARVALVSPTVDPRTATFKATLHIAAPGAVLRPGMFARIAIVFDRKPGALSVPRAALLEADGTESVFIVDSGKAVQRTVRSGLSSAGRVEITAGLRGDEQIVIVGQRGLKAGNAVRIVSLDAPRTRMAGARTEAGG